VTPYAIGIDLGGTHIKAVAVSDRGTVIGQATDSTRDGAAAGAWVPTIRALVARLTAERDGPPSGFGVGAPAAVEWRPLGRRVRVLPAALGDLAGAIGAARAVLKAEGA